MGSRFRIQVYDTYTKEVVASWLPGLTDEHGVVDDLVQRVALKQAEAFDLDAIVTRVETGKVGFLRREAHVVSVVRAVLEDVVQSIHAGEPMRTALEEGLLAMKTRVPLGR